VYRLIPKQLMADETRMPMWEPAELTLSDLAESSLLLATSTHRTMRNIDAIMARCLSAPDPQVQAPTTTTTQLQGVVVDRTPGSSAMV